MDFNIYDTIIEIFEPVYDFLWGIIRGITSTALVIVLLFLLVFIVVCIVSPPRPFREGERAGWGTMHVFSPERLRQVNIPFLPYNLLRWLLVDFLTRKERKGLFKPFGFTIFVGRQGAGKTVSMVHYLTEMREKYPDCKIATNFHYDGADFVMASWKDFFELRNGEDGMIFAIDEIHSEYSSSDWKDFPESLLSEISQQRKQRVKIVATAQVFSRVAKPIREQAFSVVTCSTYFGRFTYNREYDAAEYVTGDTPYMVRKKCKPIWRSLFVQSDTLRASYDTYEKIERLSRAEFMQRSER